MYIHMYSFIGLYTYTHMYRFLHLVIELFVYLCVYIYDMQQYVVVAQEEISNASYLV